MDRYAADKNAAGLNHNDDCSSSSSSSDDEGDKIRVGREYQAVVPDIIPVSGRNSDTYMDKALLVWSPTCHISDQKVDEYINLAKDKYGYNGEQALGMLFWHKHDLQQAINDLANFTPFPEEWSLEDKALFEQAFQFHGKNFHRIRQMLPEKSISALVKYYYSWKKMKSRTSLMDRQARKLAIIRNNVTEEGAAGSDPGSEMGSNTDSESDEKKDSPTNNAMTKQNSCINCGVLCSETHATAKGHMCRTCALHFRKTGNTRSTIGPVRGRVDRHFNSSRNKRAPPKGMHINHDDLSSIASGSSARQSDHILKSMDRELLTLKRIVQNNKQTISALKKKTHTNVDDFRNIATSDYIIDPEWTDAEILLAVQGIRRFGKDFQVIADVLGTKTKSDVKIFYANNRKRYNLDMLVQDHEKKNGPVKDTCDNANKKAEKIVLGTSDGKSVSNTSSSIPAINNNNNNSSKANAAVAAK